MSDSEGIKEGPGRWLNGKVHAMQASHLSLDTQSPHKSLAQ